MMNDRELVQTRVSTIRVNDLMSLPVAFIAMSIFMLIFLLVVSVIAVEKWLKSRHEDTDGRGSGGEDVDVSDFVLMGLIKS